MDHTRLSNGFGQISYLKKKNLRKPYRAMVTTQRLENGKYKRKTIGYFTSYEEAYEALLKYHELTFDEMYNLWSKRQTNQRLINASLTVLSYLSPLRSLKLSDITAQNINTILEEAAPLMPPTVRENTKFLLKELLSFSIDEGLLRSDKVKEKVFDFDLI